MNTNLVQALGRVAIVGGGNMGQAICTGLLKLPGMNPDKIVVANPGKEKRDYISAELGVRTVANNLDVLPADTLFLAVKPVKVPEVARQLAQAGIEDTLVISVAAGVSTQKIAEAIGGTPQIVRVMPNTPLTVGAGMSGISGGEFAQDCNIELVRQVFEFMGGAIIVPEDQQDIVTAISGSGPAYFELFLQSIARTGEELGLDYHASLQLALKTMLGTAKMLDATHEDLDAAIKAVSSPGGTTVAALDAMKNGNIETTIAAGVRAAAARSKELGA